MSTFVLVHGAWHGSWCWQQVRRELGAAGHEVYTPTLTGVGERSHLLAPDIDLETHIKDVVNLIRWEGLTDITLCGHSYGGIVVTGVADRLPERIRALVYLDAFVPDDGDSLWRLLPEEQRMLQEQAVREHVDGWRVPPIPAEVFQGNPDHFEWVDRQCTDQPLETLRQGIRLGGGINAITNVTYIRATGFDEGSPFPPFERKAEARGWKVLRMHCGHDVMLDMPEELTAALIGAA